MMVDTEEEEEILKFFFKLKKMIILNVKEMISMLICQFLLQKQLTEAKLKC